MSGEFPTCLKLAVVDRCRLRGYYLFFVEKVSDLSDGRSAPFFTAKASEMSEL